LQRLRCNRLGNRDPAARRPGFLAAAHQAGALLVFSAAIFVVHSLR